MINIKHFDPSLLKIDKKSDKNIAIQYIGYITIKETYYVDINSANHLYLIINNEDEYIAKKIEINTQLLLLQIKIKKYQQNTQNIGIKLKITLQK